MRHIAFERLLNFRDLGGYRTADGRSVAWRRLYRSDSLGKLAGADWAAFQALGVRTVIDLRHPWEVRARGRVPAHERLAYHNLSIEHRPYDQAGLGPEVDPARFLADRYAEVAADGVAELRQVLEVIAHTGALPVVVHCASGKDRTGLVAALVLALLGVADEDIIADFALTERARDALMTEFHADYPDRTVTWPGFQHTPPEIMRLFLTELAAKHGSVHDYAIDAVNVDPGMVDALRDRLLV